MNFITSITYEDPALHEWIKERIQDAEVTGRLLPLICRLLSLDDYGFTLST